jgi:benzoyl-CoA 2,3-dioxygenase component A
VRKQHLIDPAICIRCNTCERRCPTGAISHDERNYIVDAKTCTFCMVCVRPCPTGAIDNWLMVDRPYSTDEQMAWHRLPRQATGLPVAFRPPTNVFRREAPATAVVASSERVTTEEDGSEVRLMILDFGATHFPFLEGQSLGVVPPGTRPDGRPRAMRLYSVASARDGEVPGTNTVALFVRRVTFSGPGGALIPGQTSNWLCDRAPGDQIQVLGPFGETFLLPDDPEAELLMIGTGTGRAPFRGFAQRRLRTAPHGPGQLHIFFGARTPQLFPAIDVLLADPALLPSREVAYSKAKGQEAEHVQDRMRRRSAEVASALKHDRLHVYVCGSLGLEETVNATLDEIAVAHGIDWPGLRQQLLEEGRFHAETY